MSETETLEIRTYGIGPLPLELGEDAEACRSLWLAKLPPEWVSIDEPSVEIFEPNPMFADHEPIAIVKGRVRYRFDALVAQRRALHDAAEKMRAAFGEETAVWLHLHADSLGRPVEGDGDVPR